MSNFTWLPFFEEMLSVICKRYDKYTLCKLCHEILGKAGGLNDRFSDGSEAPLKEIDPNFKPTQEEIEKIRNEMMPKMMAVQGACMFYAELVKNNKDAAYYGDKVTSDDVDAILMRWKISDDEYRVIFGDLTTENVPAEESAELETKLPE